MRNEDGFSLIETIVAVAIASTMVAGFYRIYGTGYGAMADIRARTQALELARAHMERLGVTAPLRAGSSSGTLEGRFRWRADVRPIQRDGSGQPRAFHIEYSVESIAGQSRLRLQTIRLQDVQR